MSPGINKFFRNPINIDTNRNTIYSDNQINIRIPKIFLHYVSYQEMSLPR